MDKKGVSPIIATVLLITLVVILVASLIFWVKGFLNERITKEGALADAEAKCTQLNIDLKNVQIFDTSKLIIDLTNSGSEDISAITLRIEDSFNNINIKTIDAKVRPFETFSQTIDVGSVSSGNKVTIIPNVRPPGTGAPLVPCSGDIVKKVTLK